MRSRRKHATWQHQYTCAKQEKPRCAAICDYGFECICKCVTELESLETETGHSRRRAQPSWDHDTRTTRLHEYQHSIPSINRKYMGHESAMGGADHQQ
ncbi:hypothetical protein O3P69_010204 [Scylla paramamosain]|uniref:Uncharacterized protein n=1 Tax=Scylla paramamosain TaxID=85552 RepID=A0AAW0TSS7_SCYPA